MLMVDQPSKIFELQRGRCHCNIFLEFTETLNYNSNNNSTVAQDLKTGSLV